MRKSKLFRILALVIIPVVLAVALGFIIAGNQGKDADPTVGTTAPSIHVGAPTDPTDSDPTIGTEDPSTPTDPDVPTGSDEILNDDTGLTPEEPTEPSQTPTEPTKPDNTTPVTPEKPVQPPVDTEDDTAQGGITIGGGTTEYNCGTAGHNCDGPETHAYIQNLELKGCPRCGSHSCASFYAVDEWGNTCYTPSKCPSYYKKEHTPDASVQSGRVRLTGRDGLGGHRANAELAVGIVGNYIARVDAIYVPGLVNF